MLSQSNVDGNFPKKGFVIVNEDLKRFLKNAYEKTEDDIKQDVGILREWLQKQPHLPQTLDDIRLEGMLMRNKFRIEQTKKKIDGYYTLKGKHSDFFDPKRLNLDGVHMDKCLQASYLVPLPKALPNGERIIFFKIKNPDPTLFDMVDCFAIYFMMLEVLLPVDYCVGQRVVCDLADLNFGHYTRVDPIVLYKGMKICQDALSSRFSGMNYVNAPKFVEVFNKLLSPFMKDGKISIHPSMESLYEVVPKEYLPDEFGGTQGKLQDIQDVWIEQLKHNMNDLLKLAQTVSNESLRVEPLENTSDIFGVEGCFKQINID